MILCKSSKDGNTVLTISDMVCSRFDFKLALFQSTGCWLSEGSTKTKHTINGT